MAGWSCRINRYQQGIAVTIIVDFLNLLGIATGRAFVPQLLTASTPKPGFATLYRQTDTFLIGPGHHENLFGGCILNDGRNKSGFIKFQMFDGQFLMSNICFLGRTVIFSRAK